VRESDAASPVEPALRAGLALYVDGQFHAAHEPWEAVWLDATGETERLLHGLIQLTAALHHTTEQNWAGARGLAETAPEYLAGLDRPHGVELDPAREFCRRLAADPVVAERAPPPPVAHHGRRVGFDSLGEPGLRRAVTAVAAETGDDTDVLESAVEFADGTGPFRPLIVDFLGRAADRRVIYQRLSEHVDRRRHEAADVRGLFETDD
jgi:Domain of unknown function (DUF309).